jgi:hypothetical protein
MINLHDTKSATLQDALDYLQLGLASFEHDPADNDFQLGYKHAIRNLLIDLRGDSWCESLRSRAPELSSAPRIAYSWGRIGEAISEAF